MAHKIKNPFFLYKMHVSLDTSISVLVRIHCQINFERRGRLSLRQWCELDWMSEPLLGPPNIRLTYFISASSTIVEYPLYNTSKSSPV